MISALYSYIAAVTNANIAWSSGYILSAREIDEFVSNINYSSLVLNSSTSFLTTQRLYQNNTSSFGAYYIHNIGGGIINAVAENNTMNASITAAAILSRRSLLNATFVRIFIIDKPTTYKNIDRSNEHALASSVIVVSVDKNSSTPTPMNISLYFQILNEYIPDVSAVVYACAFYDLSTEQWNEYGCTKPVYNILFNRYECSCNHLSTFALVWSLNKTSCNAINRLSLPNGTCVSHADAQV